MSTEIHSIMQNNINEVIQINDRMIILKLPIPPQLSLASLSEEDSHVTTPTEPSIKRSNSLKKTSDLTPPSLHKKICDMFDFITEKPDKEMFINAYEAITLCELWDFMKQPIESYWFSTNVQVRIISKKMNELGYYGHSGSSFGWIMRQMQEIAQNGIDLYKKNYVI